MSEIVPINNINYCTGENCYKMDALPHGIALIISNTKFEDGEELPDRTPGGNTDEKNLSDLFKILKYKVLLLQNLTVSQIEMALKIVTRSMNYSDIKQKLLKKKLKKLEDDNMLVSDQDDSFVCCFLSHGDKGVVYGTDGGEFSIKSIFKIAGDDCSLLRNKPKMVFVQACRGGDIAHLTADGPPKWVAHFLFAYPTFSGHASFKDNDGSWYIQSLCSVFKEYHKKEDLVRMIGLVHKKEGEMRGQTEDDDTIVGQVPEMKSTLQKRVYFFPVSTDHPVPPVVPTLPKNEATPITDLSAPTLPKDEATPIPDLTLKDENGATSDSIKSGELYLEGGVGVLLLYYIQV